MDERLQKALDHSNYMVTLNNQKRLLREQYKENLVYYYNGGQFTVTQELISFCQSLVTLEQDGTILNDDNSIPIEVDNVVLDLNGHELKQSPAFYLQQRWFIIIELASKAFLDGQGPTWTGTGITFTKNTIVKNGIIGLSSHIGIHGSNITDVTLQDLTIKNFETHGIGINEHNGLTIQNVEVGPSVNGHCM